MDGIPMRIASVKVNNDWEQAFQVPTDFYYGELTCDWDRDGDGLFGEYGDDMTKDNCDYQAEAWVGRLPWDNPVIVRNMVDTIIAYETDESERMKKALGAAATLLSPCDSATMVNLARYGFINYSGYASTALYEDCPLGNPDMELTRQNFLSTWEVQEPGFVAWFSHGDSYNAYYNNSLDTFIDVNHLPQIEKPAIAIAAGCTEGNPEVESLGRIIVGNGIAAGFLGFTRPNGTDGNAFNALYSHNVMIEYLIFRRHALSAAKADGLDYYSSHEQVAINTAGYDFHRNIFGMIAYGDPAIQAR